MLLRKAFITYFSQPPSPPKGIWLLLCSVMLFCTVFNGFAGEEPVKGEEKEKSELAEIMGEIDKVVRVTHPSAILATPYLI